MFMGAAVKYKNNFVGAIISNRMRMFEESTKKGFFKFFTTQRVILLLVVLLGFSIYFVYVFQFQKVWFTDGYAGGMESTQVVGSPVAPAHVAPAPRRASAGE
jgi:hypothetical protein